MASAAGLALQPAPQAAGSAARGVLQRCGPVPCNCEESQDGGALRRTAVESAPAADDRVPPIVHEVLRSPGEPLTPEIRAFFETRLGHDFSGVRVHTEETAAASARAVNSLAYTVGSHVVLGDGAHGRGTPRNVRLLAHELAHVVQQTRAPALQSRLTIGDASDPAEREADTVADRVATGGMAKVYTRGQVNVVQRQLTCPELISASDVKAVSGIGNPAHDAIEAYFRGQVGAHFWRQRIPGASFGAYRTEDIEERRRRSRTGTEQVEPLISGGRGGYGTPDLGYREARSLEVAEIKPAILHYGPTGGLVEGAVQLANYVLKGNAPENRSWRANQRPRIDLVLPMNTARAKWPGTLDTSSGRKIAVGWCAPGLIGYRPLSEEEAETVLCGVSDQKAIDKLLNLALGKAQGAVDSFIDTSVDALLSQKIQTLTIREGLRMLATHGRGALSDFLNEHLGPGSGALVELLPDDQLVEEAASWLEKQVGQQTEALLRQMILQVKTELLNRVRRQIKERLRTYLQESLAAVCAVAAVGATVSAAQLLKKLTQDIGKLFGEAVVEVVKDWAIAAAKELAKDLLIALLAAIAIVAIIIFLPEILAALVAVGEVILAAGAAAAALGPRLLPLIDQVVRAILQAAPALQGAP